MTLDDGTKLTAPIAGVYSVNDNTAVRVGYNQGYYHNHVRIDYIMPLVLDKVHVTFNIPFSSPTRDDYVID